MNLQRGKLGPGRIIVDPARSQVWVYMYCAGLCAAGEQLWLLDDDLRLINRWRIATGCADSLFAPGMALEPTSGAFVVGGCGRDQASVFEQVAPERRLKVPESGAFAVIDGALIALSHPITVIGLGTGAVQARVDIGSAASEAVRYKDSLYLLNALPEEELGRSKARITEVDIATWTVRRTIPLPADRECMALDADRLLLTSGGAEDVVIVDLDGAPAIRTAPIPSMSCDLAIDSSRRAGYMSYEDESGSGVLAIDLDDFEEIARLSNAESGFGWVGLDADDGEFYAVGDGELVQVAVS